ncbi:MAG: xylulokinase [Lachnospiraceae bacterium]|nr:xylulokinase [Lachnospiraceae bacterium]
MHYYLGIDVGTSSTKTLLMSEDGQVIGVRQKGYDIIKKQLQYAEQDMEELWDAVKQTIAELKKDYPKEVSRVRGISYSGQMHGLVMVDKNGKLIRDAIIWADQRSKAQIDRIYETVGKEAYRNTILNSLSTGFLISSLMWVKEMEPEHYEQIRYVMFPKDYIRYRMCGEFGTDMSDASSGAVFDTKRRTWAWDLIEKLGLNREIFPDRHESREVAGVTTEACARETGLQPGVTIAYGGGDTLMQAVGNGIVREGILAANIGTACQLSGVLGQPLYDPAFRTNTFCHVDASMWILMGANLSGGVALKWLMNQVLEMKSYDAMTSLASKVPAGSEGLLFLPYLSGERTPYNDPNAKAIYFGMTLKHTRAHFIRSAMEGIVFGMRNSAEIFHDLGVCYEKIIASGGGARGRLFLEMQADILDSEIYTNQSNEQACMGAAITAAVACGAYKDYQEACGVIVHLNDTVVLPNKENQKKYREQYEVYKELYPHNKDLF